MSQAETFSGDELILPQIPFESTISHNYFLIIFSVNDKRKAREREVKGISFSRELDGTTPHPYAASVGLADR